ncbi:Ribonucleoside-diphosphate reductase 2 subunit beta [compost metagenome]
MNTNENEIQRYISILNEIKDDRLSDVDKNNIKTLLETNYEGLMKARTIVHHLEKIDEIKGNNEPLEEKYNLFPIQDEDAYKFYKLQEASMWNVNELDFSDDATDLASMDPYLVNMIKVIHIFFSIADGYVGDLAGKRLMYDCETKEEEFYMSSQTTIENVHNETYSLIESILIPDETGKAQIRNELAKTIIGRKMEWMNKWFLSDKPRMHRLIANACMEGIFFQSSFLIIFWFRSRGVLRNVIFANEQISKDEGIHTKFSINRHNMLRRRIMQILRDAENVFDDSIGNSIPSIEEAHQIVREAIEIEKEFARFVVPKDYEDLTIEGLETYIDTLGSFLLKSLEYPVITGDVSDNLPGWIKEISNEIKSNFYEVTVGSYKQFNLEKAIDWRSKIATAKNKTVNNKRFTNPEEMNF